MDYSSIAQHLAASSEVALRPASPDNLAALRDFGVPPQVLAFYELFEPSDCLEIARVRLWPIEAVLTENRAYVPGVHLAPFHHVVFASTVFGDAYCWDLTTPGPAVVLVAHDLNFEKLRADTLAAVRKPIAADFASFLMAFGQGLVDRDPTYPRW